MTSGFLRKSDLARSSQTFLMKTNSYLIVNWKTDKNNQLNENVQVLSTVSRTYHPPTLAPNTKLNCYVKIYWSFKVFMALSDYFQMLGRSVLAVHRRKILLRRKHRYVRKEFLPDKLNCERRVCFLSYHKSYWHAIEANCFEFCLCMWWNDESGVSRRVLDDTNLPKWIDYVVNENKVISSHLGGARAVASFEKTKFCLAADSRQRQNFSENLKVSSPALSCLHNLQF